MIILIYEILKEKSSANFGRITLAAKLPHRFIDGEENTDDGDDDKTQSGNNNSGGITVCEKHPPQNKENDTGNTQDSAV